jgi:hypothetical protein
MSSDINVQTFSGKVNINNNLLVGSSHFYVDTVGNKVGITTASPDAGLHVNSNAYVNTDFRVGTSIVMNDTAGQITAGSFVGDGSAMTGINSDSGSWVNGTGNVYLSTTTDKVGIGTSDPSSLLHLNDSTTNNGAALQIQGSSYSTTFRQRGTSSTDRHLQIETSPNAGDNKILEWLHLNSASTGWDTMLTMEGNGNIGIGTTSPGEKLHLYDTINEPTIALQHLSGTENISSTNILGNLALHYSARNGGYPSVGIRSIRRANTWDDQADMEFYVRNGGHGEQTAMVINSASTSGGAKVGIGTTNPEAVFDVRSGTEIPRLRGDAGRSLFMGSNYTHVNSTGFSETSTNYSWGGYPGVVRMNSGGEWRVHGQLSYNVLIRTDGGFVPFTGLHETYLPFDEEDQGKIVYSTGNYASELKDGNVDGVVWDYLTVLDACPVVKICATENDKRVMGVLSTRHRRTQIEEITKEQYELITGDEKYAYEKKEGSDVYIRDIDTDEFSRGYYNAVGEGGIWVCNKNGNLENGDYITSSTVTGYGQKQNDDLLHNYTVAKITTDCDFSEIWVTTKKHKKTREGYLFDENNEPVYENILDAEGNTRTHLKFKIRYLLPDGTQISEEEYMTKALANEEVYIAAFVGCTYHCG